MSAGRCSTFEWINGKRVLVWANRCNECGELYAAPDPSRAPGRKRARRHYQQLRELVQAGQLPLFPERRR